MFLRLGVVTKSFSPVQRAYILFLCARILIYLMEKPKKVEFRETEQSTDLENVILPVTWEE